MQNALPFAANLQPGGGLLQLLPAGADIGAAGGPVPPNTTVTYVWGVPSAAGPGPADFSTVAYTYHSSVDPTAHENAGLLGAVVIARKVRLLRYIQNPAEAHRGHTMPRMQVRKL